MSNIRCLIVEDEPVSQEILKKYISDLPVLELVGVCGNAIEATDKLKHTVVDLLFLDVNMPRVSGIEFYHSLINPPQVIFTTAYPQYAVEGFELNAVDYLVKPFSFARFLKAINKLTDKEKDQTDYVVLHADKKMHKVNLDEIMVVQATGDYVKVRTTNRTIIVHQTLTKLSAQLPSSKFYRIHKSFIISLPKLQTVEGNMAIVAGESFPIGQTYRESFLGRLGRTKR
jgi:DNA-binding LytR/AlgR family response regulator